MCRGIQTQNAGNQTTFIAPGLNLLLLCWPQKREKRKNSVLVLWWQKKRKKRTGINN